MFLQAFVLSWPSCENLQITCWLRATGLLSICLLNLEYVELIYTEEWNVSCRCTDLRKSFSRSPAVGSIRQRKSSYCNADCEVCSNWVKSFLFPSFQETSKLAELSFCSLLLCSLGVLWKRTLLVTLCSMEIASVLTAREPGPFKKMPPSLTVACKDALTGQGWAPISDK